MQLINMKLWLLPLRCCMCACFAQLQQKGMSEETQLALRKNLPKPTTTAKVGGALVNVTGSGGRGIASSDTNRRINRNDLASNAAAAASVTMGMSSLPTNAASVNADTDNSKQKAVLVQLATLFKKKTGDVCANQQMPDPPACHGLVKSWASVCSGQRTSQVGEVMGFSLRSGQRTSWVGEVTGFSLFRATHVTGW